MSTIDPARRPDLDALIRALIEEARKRARRRRALYGGAVVVFAVVGTVLFATLQGPSKSEGNSPAVAAGPSTPVARVTPVQHVYHGRFNLSGKRGRFVLGVAFPGGGKPFWNVVNSDFAYLRSGQYGRVAAGHGKHVEAGGHAGSWYARLVGFVIPNDGPAQRVVIKLKGRPGGTYVVVPTQPGVLKGDSGTQSSVWLG